jgi:polysaccharide export outer membrane protein
MRNIKISLIISLIGILFFSVLNVYAQGLSDEASRYYDRGQRYYNQGKYKEAQQDFKKALTIISDSGQQGTPAQKEVQSGYQHAASYASEEQRKEIPPAPEKAVAAPQEAKPLEYTISIGDTLYITVWQEDLSAEVIVRPDGMISFPLVGDVRAGGLVISQLNAELTKRLQDYIKYPQVTVLLRKFGGKNVVILGQVGFPGVYATTGKVTVLEAVALAGGFTQDAVLSSVIIIRGGLANPKGVRVNLNRAILKADMSQNLVLDPQDIIYVPKNFIANVNYVVNQIIGPLSSGAQSSFSFERLRDARW